MSALRIGISAAFFHADPQRAIFKGKTLLYLEESIAHWILSEGAHALLIPTVPEQGPALADLVSGLDGLVLQGGSDVSPRSYGEEPRQSEWSGDLVRDQYEIALFRAFRAQRKPVLGICRGAQLLNVALGGKLYQDIASQVPGARVHRDWEIYDRNSHAILPENGSVLATLFSGSRHLVNSIHHQGIKELARGFEIEARSEGDGIIEAMRLSEDPSIYAVQWHPEFHPKAHESEPPESTLLDCRPLLRKFLKEAAHAASYQPRH